MIVYLVSNIYPKFMTRLVKGSILVFLMGLIYIYNVVQILYL